MCACVTSSPAQIGFFTHTRSTAEGVDSLPQHTYCGLPRTLPALHTLSPHLHRTIAHGPVPTLLKHHIRAIPTKIKYT